MNKTIIKKALTESNTSLSMYALYICEEPFILNTTDES